MTPSARLDRAPDHRRWRWEPSIDYSLIATSTESDRPAYNRCSNYKVRAIEGMKIGELAQITGVKAELIRYYERIGLLPVPDRSEGNYRDFGADDRERLAFIRNARHLGFEIADIRSLLGLAELPNMDGGEVYRIATGHLEAVEQKIALLERLGSELRRMISQSRGG